MIRCNIVWDLFFKPRLGYCLVCRCVPAAVLALVQRRCGRRGGTVRAKLHGDNAEGLLWALRHLKSSDEPSGRSWVQSDLGALP